MNVTLAKFRKCKCSVEGKVMKIPTGDSTSTPVSEVRMFCRVVVGGK